MADPATNTTYPEQHDPLPEISPNDRQNEPGLEHDVVHDRAHAVLNALMALAGTTTEPDPSSILGRLASLEAGEGAPERIVTGASHILELEDAFTLVFMDHGSANEVVVPMDSEVPFPPGTRIDLSQAGAGQTSITKSDPLIVINTPETMKLRKRHAKATLIKRAAANTWDLEGNLEQAE